MARDDYFKIVYVILTELYESKRNGRKADERAISAERFKIPEGYLLDILSDLLEEGYVKGFTVADTKTGRYVTNIEDIGITMQGIEYLQDNSKMRKVYDALKEVRDWFPGI